MKETNTQLSLSKRTGCDLRVEGFPAVPHINHTIDRDFGLKNYK